MAKHPNSHAKQHERALADPVVQGMLKRLKADWPLLKKADRGQRLRELCDRGCTRRGLAKDLDCDPGTIRNDLRIAELPADEATVIEQETKPVALASPERESAPQPKDRAPVAQETPDSISSALAWNLVWFLCKYSIQEALKPFTTNRFFSALVFHFDWLRLTNRSNRAREQRQSSSPDTGGGSNLSIETLADKCRPWAHMSEKLNSYDAESQAIVDFVQQQQTVPSIIDAGVQKARRICECLDWYRHADLLRLAANLPPDQYAERVQKSVPEVRELMQESAHAAA